MMWCAHAAPPAAAQCAQGLRGRGPSRELYARRRGAVRHAGRGQPSGQGARGRAWAEALQSRAPAAGHHGSRPQLSRGRARCPRPYRGGHRTLAAAAERRRADRQHVTQFRRQMAGPSARRDLQRRIPASICGSAPRCITSILPARTSTLRSGMATAGPRAPRDAPVRRRACVVCSPKLSPARTRLRKPADLARHTLLHVNDRNDWARWLDAAGVEQRRCVARADLQSGQHGHRCRGRWPRRRACPECARGLGPHRRTIGAPVRARVARPYAYWIVCPKATANLPKIVMFRDWLLSVGRQLVLERLRQPFFKGARGETKFPHGLFVRSEIGRAGQHAQASG